MIDFNTNLTDFKIFIQTLNEFTDHLHTAKVKLEYWKQYLEVQLFKFSLHSSSLAYLLEGTPIRLGNKQVKYPDLASIYLLCRAQIENYLMFYYLYTQPQTSEEGEFKFLLYELSGLTRRQEFRASSSEQVVKKAKEKLEIEEIITKMKTNKYFQTLHLKKQNYLLSSKPSRTLGWEKLIEESHLNTEAFLTVWKLYSNYSHSEMIGSIQIKKYAEDRKELDKTLSTSLYQANILTCTIIKDVVGLFNTLDILYNTLPSELKAKIEFWWRIGTRPNR